MENFKEVLDNQLAQSKIELKKQIMEDMEKQFEEVWRGELIKRAKLGFSTSNYLKYPLKDCGFSDNEWRLLVSDFWNSKGFNKIYISYNASNRIIEMRIHWGEGV